jgi:DNA modification methylase
LGKAKNTVDIWNNNFCIRNPGGLQKTLRDFHEKGWTPITAPGKIKTRITRINKGAIAKKDVNQWRIALSTNKVHPAIFPTELAARIIRFYSFKGDLIFDPFGGSGTVGEAALVFGRHFFLCEKVAEYVEHAMQRLDAALFAATKPRVLSLTDLKSEMTACTNK